jgi:hypothetical protein
MLLDFKNNVDRGWHSETVADHAQCLINMGHRGFGELHVDGRAGDLDYVSEIF